MAFAVIVALSFLLVLPFVAYRITKRMRPKRVWAATRLTFGLIIAPASLGLYAFYFLSPFGFPLGMLGLFSLFVHDAPGFEIITTLWLRDPQQVVNAQEQIVMELSNGVCWGTIYGVSGMAIDWLRATSTNK